MAEKVLKVVPSDIGRPLTDIVIESLRAPLEELFTTNGTVTLEREMDLELPGAPVRLAVSARQIARGNRSYATVLLTFRRRT